MEWRGPLITETDVAAFEEQIGHILPADYRRFLLEVNGGGLAMANSRFAKGRVHLLFSIKHPQEDRDLITEALEERAALSRPSPDLMSIGYDEGGAPILLVIAGEHRGEVWWENTGDPRPEGSNPRVLWHDRRDMRKLADSFEQFMTKLKPHITLSEVD